MQNKLMKYNFLNKDKEVVTYFCRTRSLRTAVFKYQNLAYSSICICFTTGQFGLENPMKFSKKPMKSQNFIGVPNEFLFS